VIGLLLFCACIVKSNAQNITVTSNINTQTLTVTGTALGGTFSGTLTGTVSTAYQPNITLLGSLSELTTTGSLTALGYIIAGNFSTTTTGGLDVGSGGLLIGGGGLSVTGTVNAQAISASSYIGMNAMQNLRVFTTTGTGTYTVPAGVYAIDVEVVAVQRLRQIPIQVWAVVAVAEAMYARIS
jgi:hypothetical protein